MTDAEDRKDHLLDQIAETQEHFVDLMNGRLPELAERELELYLTLLGKLVAKLEQKDKPMRTGAQELVPELLPLVMGEFGR